MMGPGYGSAVAGALGIWFAFIVVIAVCCGVGLALAAPALWHLVAAHLSVKWS